MEAKDHTCSYKPTQYDEDFVKYNTFLDLVNNAITDIEKKMLDDMHAAVPKIPHTDPLLFSDTYYVDFADGKNRKIRARKNISKGDLLLSIKPLVAALHSKHYQKRCHFCFKKSTTLKECSMCHFAMYCQIECQRAHWSEHRLMCGIIKKSASFINPRAVPSLVYVISPLYWKLHCIDHPKYSTVFKAEILQLTQMISCIYLESNHSLVPSQLPAETLERYVELAYLLTRFNQLSVTEGNMLEFFELLCRVHGNLFSVCNEEYEYFATALYYPSVTKFADLKKSIELL